MSPGGDLFDAAAEAQLASKAPLAARLRPKTLDEVIGQGHLLGPGAPLRVLIEADQLRSAILWGPPGTGKTSLARIVASSTQKSFESLSAVASGVKDVRDALEAARRRLGERGKGTILFIDEVHRFNKSQQDVLLPGVEEGLVILIGATTENPYFSVNPPLLSRATLWRLHPLGPADLETLVRRGLELEGAEATEEALEALVGSADGDGRAALSTLELAVALAQARSPESPPQDGRAGLVTQDDVSKARDGRLYHQGADDHYDQISAFIKSVRGSDPDAGLYWLARMLEAGEDPRFLARRLVILASEDVGLADPQSLVMANAAARALEFVGLPEAALHLAQATVYLALAPKSNRITLALGRARADLAAGQHHEVPAHLRDASYRGANALGHGNEYRYPHDTPVGWVEQQYRPADLEGHIYYEPSELGEERDIFDRLRHSQD
jgi:putative ATPase